MKKGLLIGFTKWQIECAYNIYKDYLSKKDIGLYLLKIYEYVICIENGKSSIDINKYDFCIMLVKDQYISTLFEKKNKFCFNAYDAMRSSDDKFLTYVKLAEKGLPLPKTLSGNTDFDGLKISDYKRSKEFKDKVEKTLNYPFVAKPTFGYGGKGVVIINKRFEIFEFI